MIDTHEMASRGYLIPPYWPTVHSERGHTSTSWLRFSNNQAQPDARRPPITNRDDSFIECAV